MEYWDRYSLPRCQSHILCRCVPYDDIRSICSIRLNKDLTDCVACRRNRDSRNRKGSLTGEEPARCIGHKSSSPSVNLMDSPASYKRSIPSNGIVMESLMIRS